MLIGGNKTTQLAFHKEMTGDHKNSFLKSLENILKTSFDSISKFMSLTNKEIFKIFIIDRNNNSEFTSNFTDANFNIEPEDEEKQELSILKNILKLMQLFCEGHNLNMQNQLREQKINEDLSPFSINFISLTSILFGLYIKFVNVKCVELGNNLLDFLIESIQGPCNDNQLVLCKSNIIDICKDLLEKFQKPGDYKRGGFFNIEDKTEVDNVVTKSSNLLVSLIEGHPNKEIISLFNNNLDVNFLLDKMLREYKELGLRLGTNDNLNKINSKLNKTFDDDLMEAFNVYILLSTLSQYNEAIKNLLNANMLISLKNTLEFFKMHTGSIEIIFNGEIIKIFFPIQPICR